MMDFQDRTSADDAQGHFAQTNGVGDPPASARAAVASSAPASVLTPNAQGVVVLPAGVGLEDLRVEGRNLVVVAADGTRFVIPEGAIIVPQLVVDGVAIPPLNLAALLVGNEPQPAAGASRSSGGNFAADVGPIQDAYDLGDLLPYTELARPQPQEREQLPDIVDRGPTVRVFTPNQPAGAQSATASVNESGLPARPGEPAGSNAAASSETTVGAIQYQAPDGLAAVTINGVTVTGPGQVIAGSYGAMTITSVSPGVIGYSYTLADNTLGSVVPERFTVVVLESDGDTATATLDIAVLDDAPDAIADIDDIAAGTYGPATGNVVTGAGTRLGVASADVLGADGAAVTGIAGQGGTSTTLVNGAFTIAGQYGTLTIQPGGSYSYVRNPGTPGGVNDVFTYTLRDGDGSQDTATLTIAIADSPATVISVPTSGAGTVVEEAGLPGRPSEAPGSDAPSTRETTSGTVSFAAPDGPATLQINGTAITGAGQQISTPQGVLTVTAYNPVTGTLGYSFTLGDNTSGDVTSVTFTVTVTDRDGDSDTKPFTITVTDDVPAAVNDSADQAAENAAITVNVLANDTQGADSVAGTAVALVPGSLSGTGQLTYNGNGTFTYSPGLAETGTVTFRYSITDGDGDTSSATVTIKLLPDSTPRVSVAGDNDVLEAGLAARPGEPAGSQAAGDGEIANGTIAVSTGNDTLASLVINGVNVTSGGTVTTAKGVLTFAKAGNGYTYSYRLADNTLAATDSDSFTIEVKDSDGSTATTSLVVAIVDDQPSAANDSNAISAGQYGPIGGNVMANDTPGADGAVVPSYTGSNGTGAAGASVAGTYGTLTIAADGTYSYVRAPGTQGGGVDSFSYTIRDGDGDTATANLVISIADSGTTLTLPVKGAGGTVVQENALPTGSNPASTAEFASGSIAYSAPDGPAILTINGSPVTAGSNFAGLYGTLTVTAVGGGTISYTYQLTTRTSGDATADSFTVRVQDQDGDFTQGVLTIDIVDDVPTARADTDAVAAGSFAAELGNVISGVGTTSGAAGADTPGADGARVAFGGSLVGGVLVPGSGQTILPGGQVVVQGQYGQLTLNADGSYSYVREPGTPGGVTDQFRYVLVDGDGDPSPSTLTISIGNSTPTVATPAAGGATTTVYEAALAARPGESEGSSEQAAPGANGDTREAVSGTVNFTSLDGIQSLKVAGVALDAALFPQTVSTTPTGTLVITGGSYDETTGLGHFDYTYTLADNTLTDPSSVTFTVELTDEDGQLASSNLTIAITDDAPTANNDSVGQIAENTAVTFNVLTNDVQGADSIASAAVTVVPGSLTGAGTLTYGGNGSFTYTPAPAEAGTVTFRYTITDGDTDPSTATVTITLLPDSTPSITIAGDSDVLEAGLPARLGEPAGSQEAGNGEFALGTLTVGTGNDTVASLIINGVNVTTGGTVTTGKGVLTVTQTGPGGYDYSYDLKDNTLAATDSDSFSVNVTDSDGSTASSTLTIDIVDDVPTARADTDAVAAGSFAAELGNVISGVGTTSGAAGADTPGADGARVAFGGSLVGGVLVPGSGQTILPGGQVVVQGQYGQLTLNADGSYSYVREPGTPGGVTDQFRYVLVDGDGDPSPSTLTISIGNSTPTVATPAAGGATTTVYEAALAARPGESEGSSEQAAPGANGDTREAVSGTVNFTSLDGIQSLKVAGVALDAALFPQTVSTTPTGTLVITGGSYDETTGLGHFDYTYTLADNTLTDPSSVTFTVELTDEDGQLASSNLTIAITDDAPTANNDSGTQSGPNAAVTINVLANDVQGADSVANSAVAAVPGSLTGTGTLAYNNNGTFTYTPSPAESGIVTFQYTITDGDNDPSTATVTINLLADTVATAVNGTAATSDAAGDGDPASNTNAFTTQTSSGSLAFDYGADGKGSFSAAYDGGLGAAIKTTAAGVTTFTGTGWTLTINETSGAYTFTQTAPYAHDAGASSDSAVVTVTIADTDGPPVTVTLGLTITDDGPVAANDAVTTIEGALASTGNVIANDDVGADIAGTIIAVRTGTEAAGTGTALTVGAPFVGTFGTLTLNANGTYTYTPKASAPSGSVDVFTYTVRDADGDTDTAELKFTFNGDANLPTAVSGTAATSDAAGDADPASNTNAFTTQTSSGSLAFDYGLDGKGTFAAAYDGGLGAATKTSAAGVTTFTGTGWTLTINETSGAYVFTQTAAYAHDAGASSDGATVTVTLTDTDGSTKVVTLGLTITDDGPVAANDAVTTIEGAVASTGNVITNDDVGADVPGTIIAVRTGTEAAGTGTALTVGTPFVGTFGTLTLNANGSYTYTPKASVPSGSVDVFTYTVRDADGDTDTAELKFTFNGDANLPTAANVTAVVDDDGLTGGNPASATGDRSSNLGFNDVAGGGDDDADGAASSEATFSGNLGFGFGVDGAGPAASDFLFTTANGATVGQETVNFAWNEATGTLSAIIATSPGNPGRVGLELFNVVVNQTTGAYTLTLVRNVLHANGSDENDATLALTYQVKDSDSSSANGTLTITFDDDAPSAFTPASATVINNGAGSASGPLDTVDNPAVAGTGIFDNAGADGIKSIAWASTLEGQQLTGGNGALTAGGKNIFLHIQPDGSLLATTDTTSPYAAAENVFTATLNQATGQYQITFFRKIDDGSGTKVADFSATKAGQNEWNGVDPDRIDTNGDGLPDTALDIASASDPNADSTDLLFTPSTGGTINTSATDIGVSNQWIDAGEALRVDLVQDLRRDAGQDETNAGGYLYDTHVGVTQASFTILQAKATSSVRITATNVDDNNATSQSNVQAAGINSPVNLNHSTILVKNSAGTTLTAGVHYTVYDDGNAIIVSGLDQGDVVSFGAQSNATFEAFQVENVAGATAPGGTTLAGDDFALGAFAYSFVAIGSPVTFSLPVVLTDGDGDTANGSISVNLNPVTPVVLDLDGDGVEFVGLSQGVTYDYGASAVQTAWAGSDDGILAYDANGSGGVDASGEFVFGGNGQTDLEALAAKFDINHDGALDGQDAEFAKFGVWQDANLNGQADAGEFSSLSALGITSIGLLSDSNVYRAAAGDVLVSGEAGFVRNGATFALADAAFATAPIDRRVSEVATTAAIAGAIAAVPAYATAPVVPGEASEITLVSADLAPHAAGSLFVPAETSDPVRLESDLLSGSDRPQPTAEQTAHTQDQPDTAIRLDAATDHASSLDSGEGGGFHAANDTAFEVPLADGTAVSGMDALLTLRTETIELPQIAQTQEHEIVKEALVNLANEGIVDAIVNHFVVGGDLVDTVAANSNFTPGELADHLDGHTVAVGTGVEAIDDAAQALALAQA